MILASDVATIPGWYGKLPSLGDFASRRLEADFIEPWDLWLGEALAGAARSDGRRLARCLSAEPALALPADARRAGRASIPQLVLAGVLMPSVDRVGRYFPLTIAATIAGLPTSDAAYEALLGWLHRLEDTALDALQDDWTIEQLEAALVEPGAAGARRPTCRSITSPHVRAALADGSTARAGSSPSTTSPIAPTWRRCWSAWCRSRLAPAPAAGTSLAGRALWLADNPDHPQLLVSRGLPAHEDFIRHVRQHRARAGRRDDLLRR